jgi:hypothetical protein
MSIRAMVVMGFPHRMTSLRCFFAYYLGDATIAYGSFKTLDEETIVALDDLSKGVYTSWGIKGTASTGCSALNLQGPISKNRGSISFLSDRTYFGILHCVPDQVISQSSNGCYSDTVFFKDGKVFFFKFFFSLVYLFRTKKQSSASWGFMLGWNVDTAIWGYRLLM